VPVGGADCEAGAVGGDLGFEMKGIARRRKRRWEDEILTPQT
jgi:hypothetical protein